MEAVADDAAGEGLGEAAVLAAVPAAQRRPAGGVDDEHLGQATLVQVERGRAVAADLNSVPAPDDGRSAEQHVALGEEGGGAAVRVDGLAAGARGGEKREGEEQGAHAGGSAEWVP